MRNIFLAIAAIAVLALAVNDAQAQRYGYGYGRGLSSFSSGFGGKSFSGRSFSNRGFSNSGFGRSSFNRGFSSRSFSPWSILFQPRVFKSLVLAIQFVLPRRCRSKQLPRFRLLRKFDPQHLGSARNFSGARGPFLKTGINNAGRLSPPRVPARCENQLLSRASNLDNHSPMMATVSKKRRSRLASASRHARPLAKRRTGS